MPTRADIIGAARVLKMAGYDIVGKNTEGRDFGYEASYAGAIDIVGDDDDDDDDDDAMAGAIRRIEASGARLTHKQKEALRKAHKAAKKDQRQKNEMSMAEAIHAGREPAVRTGNNFSMRSLNLNLGSVVVPAAGVNFLTARAQEPLRIERILLDPNGAAFSNLFVSSIFAGVKVQAANLGESPLIAYSFNATGSYLKGNTVDAGVDFVINFRNGTGAAVTISGTVFGTALQA